MQQAREENRVFQETRLFSERHRHVCTFCFAIDFTGTRKIKTRTEPKERTGTHQTRKRRKGKSTSQQVRITWISGISLQNRHVSKGWGSQSSFLFSGLDRLHAASTGCSLYIDLVNNTLIWTDNSQGSLHVGGLCAAQYFL